MSAAERNAAYEASLAAWCARIAPVLADVDASRALALAVVGLLLRLLAPTKGSMPWDIFEALKGVYYEVGFADFGDLRRRAWKQGSRAAAQRLPWLETIASCLCRACEDERLLTRGAEGKARCTFCGGRGREALFTRDRTCASCHGSGWQPSGPVAPPLLALLLHDAHSLLTESCAAPRGLEDLVNEHLRQVHDPRE